MHCARVLALVVLLVGLVHSFSWDIVLGGDKQLEFYHHGTLTHTEVIPSVKEITSVNYDPVHNRLLFTDYNNPTMSIYSFDLSTRKTQLLVTRTSEGYSYYPRVDYDPVTQTFYWSDGKKIYSSLLNPASSNKAVRNLLVTLDQFPYDLAVDSCGGYIYWITDEEVGRARLDGSEREVLIHDTVYLRLSLAIDQQTQRMYWIERTRDGDDDWSIKSANFNGKNRTTLYSIRNTRFAFSLAVSKDFIYWQNYAQEGIWQLPKNETSTATKLHSMSNSYRYYCHRLAANYTLEEQIQGINSCHTLQALIPIDSKSESTVSTCQNYCFQGECSVSAEGRPTCSCTTGYSGERCEENACHKYCLNGGVCSLIEEDEPSCQCTAGYDGEQCEVSADKDNSCDADNSGDVTVSACHQFCLNNGVCSLNKASQPVCQCTADYEGARCDVPAFVVKWFLYAYRNVPPVALSEAVKSTRASTVV